MLKTVKELKLHVTAKNGHEIDIIIPKGTSATTWEESNQCYIVFKGFDFTIPMNPHCAAMAKYFEEVEK